MSDQMNINEVIKELSINMGKDFVEDLKQMRKNYHTALHDSFDGIAKDNPEYKNLLDDMARDITNNTFQVVLRVIHPMWEKIEALDKEIKFLKQR